MAAMRRPVCRQELPGQVRAREDGGAWTDSDMQGGPVDELLDVAVQRPAVDQLEVEVGRTLEDWFVSGLAGDHRKERHLDAINQTGGLQFGNAADDTAVAGRLRIWATHGSRTSDSAVLEASIRANARYVLAPKTIR